MHLNYKPGASNTFSCSTLLFAHYIKRKNSIHHKIKVYLKYILVKIAQHIVKIVLVSQRTLKYFELYVENQYIQQKMILFSLYTLPRTAGNSRLLSL